jgi:hypothetical protein
MSRASRKNLPPLGVGTAYVAADFETFEYFGVMLTGSKATLRLHLKNGTSIDLPCDDTELKRLTLVLCEAFGPVVIEHLKSRGWV